MRLPCGGDIMMMFDGIVLHLLLKLSPDFCPLSRLLHESLSVHQERSRIQKALIASAIVVLETFSFILSGILLPRRQY